MKSLYWIRSDLRTTDNEALATCWRDSSQVTFVFAPTASLRRAGPYRKSFYLECLSAFREELQSQESPPATQMVNTDQSFPEFLQGLSPSETPDRIYFNKEFAFEERQEESEVERLCHDRGITLHPFEGSTIIAQSDLPFSLDQMPFIFTDFRKKVECYLTVYSVKPLVTSPFYIRENPATARLHHYLWNTHSVQRYKETRNGMIQFDDSSKLSPWLSVGAISPRMIYHELKRYEIQVCKNESTYWLFFELLWREYFKYFSLKFGRSLFLPEGLRPGKSSNRNDLVAFQSWKEGRTPDRFINANMNELNQTGWMSNRGRQNVASYLIHDLGVNWTWGATYFEEMLIDYDPDSNWGNWLYLSGRGSDPRARKFNTALQAETYDPDCRYRALWDPNSNNTGA